MVEQTDYGGKSTDLKDIEKEVKAAFESTIRKAQQTQSIPEFVPVSTETVEQQNTAKQKRAALPDWEQSKKQLNNRGITPETMDFGSYNPAPVLRDHIQYVPARQTRESVAQTFAGVHKLAQRQADTPAASAYETEKERLRQAAEQEFLHNTTDWGQTVIRNFAVNSDSPQTAALINYLQLLLQSPNGIAYERYTAAEQEAEKEQRIDEIKEWANENGRSPILSEIYGEDTNGILNLPSGISLVTAPFRGADYLLDVLETAYVGEPLPSSVPDFTETTQALREGVSQNMTETGQFIYHTAMSAADSLIANALGGEIGGAIILGLGTASDTAHDIMDRGGTVDDALIGGAVSGILEGVFEKISLGQLKAMKLMPADSVKTVLKNVAKSVVTNASEELITEIANTIFDTIFMGELSTYELTVQGYLSQGKSERDARWLATADILKRVAESAISGALTGILFGIEASAESYVRSQFAARGEAKLRAQEMPTPKELEAMNASEAEARGAMVLLNLDQVDGVEGDNQTISQTDRAKTEQWTYTPSDEQYLRYKGVYDNPKYYNQETGAIIWPENNGFVGNPKTEILQPGTRIDRYGSDFGSFVSPEGTPYHMRAAAPGTYMKQYSVFEVTKPLQVTSGKISPWFDELGGGVQYLLPETIDDLLEAGIIRRIR